MRLRTTLIPACAAATLLISNHAFAQAAPAVDHAKNYPNCVKNTDILKKRFDARRAAAEADKRVDANEKVAIDAAISESARALSLAQLFKDRSPSYAAHTCRTAYSHLERAGSLLAQASLSKPSVLMTCFGEFAVARTRFVEDVKEGMAQGKIDAAELAELQKLHKQMNDLEHKALADDKLAIGECLDLHLKADQAQDRLRASLVAGLAPYSWVKDAAGKAVVGGDPVKGKPLNICRMVMPDGLPHPGMAWNGTCYVSFGGKVNRQPATELLVASGPTRWEPFKDGKIPESALEAAALRGNPINFCRAKGPDNQLRPGKSYKGNCYISHGNDEVKVAQHEVLTLVADSK